MKHFVSPAEFSKNICKALFSNGDNSKPILIFSQLSVLSTFVSYELLTNYKSINASLIDIGKPLETLFLPEVVGGGAWRDEGNLRDHYFDLYHFMSKETRKKFLNDTSVSYIDKAKLKKNMDCEDPAIYRKTLF